MLFHKKYFNIRPYLFGLNAVSVLFAIPTAVLGGFYNGTDSISVGFIDTVQTIVTVLVVYNIVVCVCNVVKLQSLKLPPNSRVRVFVLALLGYPIVQIISRVPTIVYLYTYGYHFQYESQSPSVGQTVALYMDYLTDPLAGIGFLIVFMYTQVGSFDVCMDFLYSLVGLTWTVTTRRGDNVPTLFHQDTAFFATSIRRVNSISSGANINNSGPLGRLNFESLPSVKVQISSNNDSNTNMNDNFGAVPADAQDGENIGDNDISINYSNNNKAIDTNNDDNDDELYSDLFGKFQEEPLLPIQYS